MDEFCSSLRVPSTLALAKVARQFAGSRIERQVLTQVFDVVWQVGQSRSWLTAAAPAESAGASARAATRVSQEGGVS